jgi:nucleoside-diphosphate-sugar epimerase
MNRDSAELIARLNPAAREEGACMANIALFGAAGAIGKSIASALGRSGTSYRVVGRSQAALASSFQQDPLAEIATWNPDDPESIRSAARDIDTIVYLVGVNYWQFQLHPEIFSRTVDGAVAAGVRQILLIGTVYPYGRPQTRLVSEEHPRDPHTFKGKMRKRQEDLLLEAEAAGRIRGTILRLPDFYGPGVEKSFLQSIFAAAANGGRAQLVGPIDVQHEYLFVPDVGPVVAHLISEPRALGRAWNLAGAGTITQRQVVEKAFALTGRKPKMMVVGKNSLRVMGIFSPLMREMVEMHYLQTEPVFLDDSSLRGLLGPIHKTSYDEGIRLSVEAAKKG